jgi:hypothetical protein
MLVEKHELDNPREILTKISVLDFRLIQDILEIIFPNKAFAIGHYDEICPDLLESRFLAVYLEWDDEMDQAEMLIRLRSGMDFKEHLEHYSHEATTR